jgi:metal-responsive CopG/Arc/MetJ family transcriptional regulator
MKQIERIGISVRIESDVLEALERMAMESQRTRTFMINHMLRHYIRLATHQAQAVPSVAMPEAPQAIKNSPIYVA